jgi:hypothetical protein
MTDIALLIPHLRALKAQIDATLMLAEMHEVMMAPPDPNACRKCGASGEMIRETAMLDNTKRFRCMSCGEEWTA